MREKECSCSTCREILGLGEHFAREWTERTEKEIEEAQTYREFEREV
jgi:hypothetical protein